MCSAGSQAANAAQGEVGDAGSVCQQGVKAILVNTPGVELKLSQAWTAGQQVLQVARTQGLKPPSMRPCYDQLLELCVVSSKHDQLLVKGGCASFNDKAFESSDLCRQEHCRV
jgi:hypothetical protein